jgi:hypothetical protein
MLRRLSTAYDWSKLSLLKLREELARRGLKRLGTREELLKRLQDHEKADQLDVGLPEDLGKVSLNSMTRSYLAQELIKRKTFQGNTVKLSKLQMVENLATVMIEEKGPVNKDLRGLMMKSATNVELMTVGDVIQVFEDLKDPYQVSQLDMNLLLNSETECMSKVWSFAVEKAESLSFQESHTLLACINTLQEYFKKRMTADGEKVKPEMIEKVLMRAKKLTTEASALDLAKLLSTAHSLLKGGSTQSLVQLKTDMMSKLTDISEIPSNDLCYIIENLPVNCNSTHGPLIKKIMEKMQPVLPELSSESLIACFFGLSNAGYEIPFRLVYHIDKVSKEFLKKLSPETLSSLGTILSQKKMMSEELMKSIIDV